MNMNMNRCLFPRSSRPPPSRRRSGVQSNIGFYPAADSRVLRPAAVILNLLVLVFFLGWPGLAGAKSAITVQNLRCEYAINPLGIDVVQPRLSWGLQSNQRGQRQTAYQILVAASEMKLKSNQGDLWDSGRVQSDQSVQVVYGGAVLTSRQRCYWKVRMWDADGHESDYSANASWEMGLLQPSDWRTRWIGYNQPTNKLGIRPGAFLRKSITIAKPVQQARLYASALGVYEFHINGGKVGRDYFTPGWTDYAKRVQYQTYDITALLRRGANGLGIILGDGWYAGYVGLGGPNRYGSMPLAIAQIQVRYADGTEEVFGTDASWRAAAGPLIQSDMLMGETYDARLEMNGWDTAGFNGTAWQAVTPSAAPAHLVASGDAPVRKTQEITPQSVTESKPGAYVFDLAQNMVGWARLKVSGPAGARVTLRFAEMLNPDGTIYTTNLRGAKCTDEYILKGAGREVYEPRFTFHGFRYVEISGYPGRPGKDAITGIVVSSDTPPCGAFECSDPLVNQLQHNIVWGQRGNFVSIPTDCPQRDERLGWMGDAQIFARTATYNMDVSRFFTKWLVDVDDAQRPDGAFTDVSPFVAAGAGTAAWGDAGVICPWVIYQVYGDTRVLEQHYEAGAKWIAYLQAHSNELLRPAEGYGDWLSIQADTPKDVLATAYFACSTRLMARIAAVLHKTDDAQKYEALFQQIKAAFNRAYVGNDGKIKGDTQTDYILALDFDLLPIDQRVIAAHHLAEDIYRKNRHLSTGFVGVGHLMPTLTQAGYLPVAYQLLLNDTFPSWLYSIRQGATTIWERWDGWTKEKGFQDPGMNSFNHYSLGSVGEWLYDTVAGIGLDPQQPGFKHIIIRPRPGTDLSSARGEYDSIHGRISSAWTIRGGTFELNVTIPVNTTASVFMPVNDPALVQEGGRLAAQSAGVKYDRIQDGCAVFAIGSGTYRFAVLR